MPMTMKAKTGPFEVETNVSVDQCGAGRWHVTIRFDSGMRFATDGYETEGEAKQAFADWRKEIGAEEVRRH